jgi:hypothetical protein
MLVQRHRRDRRDQQRAAVGRRMADRRDAHATGRAGAVLHDDGAIEREAHTFGDQPGQTVAGAAGREREHDPHRLLLRLGNRQGGECECNNDRTGEVTAMHDRLRHPGWAIAAELRSIVAGVRGARKRVPRAPQSSGPRLSPMS